MSASEVKRFVDDLKSKADLHRDYMKAKADFAKSKGYDFTTGDLMATGAELSEDDLTAIAGAGIHATRDSFNWN